MNIFQLVLKQMRQRALSTWLTLLSVLLGVGLAVAIMLLYREGDKLFGQQDFGYDVLVGAKGAKLQLVLNTIYQVGDVPPTISYGVYEQLKGDPLVRWAVPYAVGDNYKGYRVIGTTPKLFGVDEQGRAMAQHIPEYRKDRRFELKEGKVFHPRKFEAVVGWEVFKRTGLKIGDTFKASHGAEMAGGTADEHDEKWTVVGILKPTQTANDRVIFIPLMSAYAVPEHEEAMEEIAKVNAPAAKEEHHAHHEHEEAYTMNPDGTIELKLPKDKWRVSAVLVKSIGAQPGMLLTWNINNQPLAMAVNPAREMRVFSETFLKGSRLVLMLISGLVTVVAAVGILVSIYNSVSARLKEIAILRALGATRQRVLVLICLEAGLVGLAGGLIGLVVGHLLGAAGSFFFNKWMGEGINWIAVSYGEILYLAVVVLVAILAGLVPALKAYRTPVATNLTAG